eukprot:2507683-Pyramimonas_sp.AAC.1
MRTSRFQRSTSSRYPRAQGLREERGILPKVHEAPNGCSVGLPCLASVYNQFPPFLLAQLKGGSIGRSIPSLRPLELLLDPALRGQQWFSAPPPPNDHVAQ